MKTKRTQKGVHKIEFYAALEELKDLYFNKGFVVYKILYEKLKKKYNWDMTYNTFIVYAKRENLILQNQKKSLEELPPEIECTPKKKRPIITRTDEKDSFNTSNDIPDDRKL